MDKQTFLGDIQRYLAANNLTPHRFAKICQVDIASFFRFLKNPERTLQSDAIFRIWTVIYGGRKPEVLPRTVQTEPVAATQTTDQNHGDRNARPFENLPF